MKALSFELASSRGANRIGSALCAVLCLLLFVGSLSAQEYKEASVDESLAGQKSSAIASGDSAQIKNFLTKYYLARWTVRNNGRDLVKYRQELEQDAVSLSGAAQSAFLQEVVDVLKSYAGSDKCYPACRYNAVLTIGSLNVAGDRNSVATPYAEAIPTLAKIVTSNSDSVPDYVRYGALVGLVRHAQLGIKDDKMRAGVMTTFSKVLDPAYGVDHGIREEIFDCFKENAIIGLASFKRPEGPKGGTGVLDLFRQTIENKDAAFDLRCIAARAIGNMDFANVPKTYDFAGLSRSLVFLCRDFCVDNSNYIDAELVRDQVKSAASQIGGGMGGMSGGMGGGMGGGLGGGMDGGMGGMGGGLAGGMGGMSGSIQNRKSMEAIVARVQYGFESVQLAIKGKKDGGSGVKAMLNADDEKQAENIEMLDAALEEIDSTNVFVQEGPKNGANAMMGGMGGGMGGGMDMGMGGSTLNVDAGSMKDHLLEKKLKYNELLGIDSY